MKGFKYLNKSYAKSMESGEIYISTAHQLRDADAHDDGRSDPNELIEKAKIKGGEEIFSSNHPTFPDDIFVTIKQGKRIHTDWIATGEMIINYDNSLMYCVSTEFSNDLAKNMFEKFDADAVFEISDLEKFGQIISRHLELSTRQFFHGSVRYETKPISNSISEMTKVNRFKKEPHFSWQKEYRFVWDGEIPTTGFVIKTPDINPFIRRIQ